MGAQLRIFLPYLFSFFFFFWGLVAGTVCCYFTVFYSLFFIVLLCFVRYQLDCTGRKKRIGRRKARMRAEAEEEAAASPGRGMENRTG